MCDEIKEPILKTCPMCGKVHTEAPESGRWGGEETLEGLYFECECNSTLFVPKIRIAEYALDQHLIIAKCLNELEAA